MADRTAPASATDLVLTGADLLSDDSLHLTRALAALPAAVCLEDRLDVLTDLTPTRARAALRELLEGRWVVLVDPGRTMLRGLYATTPHLRAALATPALRRRLDSLHRPHHREDTTRP